jgi:hypothetical protein
MAQSMTNFDNVLKEFYEGAIRSTINNDVVMLRVLEENDRDWSGRRVLWPVHSSRNSGVGARPESGTLPTAGNQAYLLSIVSASYQYARIQLSGQIMRSSKTAFASAMNEELTGAVNDLKVDLARQTYGDGTGRLAQVGVSSTAATGSVNILVQNRFAAPGQPGARYIEVGQGIDVGRPSSTTGDFSSQTVSAVSLSSNPATTTDTVVAGNSAGAYSSSESFLFRAGTSGGLEIQGLRGLIDVYSESNIWGSNGYASATVQGISRATSTQWNSIVLGNSQVARVLDANLMQSAFDQISIESGLEPDMIIAHHSVLRAFFDHVSADRRYNTSGGALGFDGGQSSLSFNGVKMERDRHAPYNEMFIFNKAALKKFTLLPIEWADDDGSILSRVSGQDAFEAFLRTYFNLGLNANPKAACVIRDIKTDF